jgi:hypothetical protein
MLGSLAFTLGGILVLDGVRAARARDRRRRASASRTRSRRLTILFLALDPHGDAEMVNLLKGDILATTRTSLSSSSACSARSWSCCSRSGRSSCSSRSTGDLAVVFGKRVALWTVSST